MSRHVIEVKETLVGSNKLTQPGMSVAESNKVSNHFSNRADIESASREASVSSILKAAVAEVSFGQVNDYIGRFTTNTLAARKRGLAISYGSLVYLSAKAPMIGIPAMIGFTAHKHASFGIEMNLLNTRSDYMNKLAGSTYNMSQIDGMGL